jgi:hypothetical protein
MKSKWQDHSRREQDKAQIELKNTVIIPRFEKNIVSMLRLYDEGYEFNITVKDV